MAFYTWHKITNPGTGWFASKTSGWTADSFSGGLEVDFSSVVPAGTKAVRCHVALGGTFSVVNYRPKDDSNISNTPYASSEWSSWIMSSYDGSVQAVLWLSADYKVEFTVHNTATDLYVAYPIEYML